MTNFYERQNTVTITKGPDFTRCGQPVDWADQAEVDERFAAAVEAALAALNVDIELVRWSPEDPLNGEYITWWNIQARALRRDIAGRHLDGVKPTIRRRTDADGIAKCYLRFDRQRVKAVAA